MKYRLEDLERLRDRRFRRLPRLRVYNERTALDFVNDVGFCLVFTNRTHQLPCLWVAVCGRRDPVFPEHSHHDPELMLTWNLKDLLPAKRLVYYGKLLLGKPSMVALTQFPYFYALHGPQHDEQYRYDYEDGLLSRAAKQIMDALIEAHPQTTKELKRRTRLDAAKSRSLFDQAIAELQRRLYITMIEARYDPVFTYIWDLLETWLPDPVAQGRDTPRDEAVYQLVRQYLSVVSYASLTHVERVIGVPRLDVEATLARLQDEGMITTGVAIDGLPGTWVIWRDRR
ncbi:MAG TPA: crosslink repair DNA glycosylase YcaQ family protein [Alphaproteobacteria bacterium]|nr:crosslink repair DNA glycosylase YcaQ family protein [Alphaproteobacteria bacterium]